MNKEDEQKEGDDDFGEESEAEEREKGPLGSVMREIAMTGLATFFMTEDSVRKYLKEKKFPKDLTSNLLDTVGKRKEDFYRVLAKELGQLMSKSDLEKSVSQFLESHEVNVTLNFTRKGQKDKA